MGGIGEAHRNLSLTCAWVSGSAREQIRHMAGSDSGRVANTSMAYSMRLPRARLLCSGSTIVFCTETEASPLM